jgi:CrcB protein
MERLLWVCLAGAIGCGVRYLVGAWAGQRFGTTFPYGTMIVNVTGCFLIAVVMHVALRVATFPAELRFALATGFLGGLTTYSSFNYETTRLMEDGSYRAASINFAVTVVACFVAGIAGTELARRFVGE